jgi:hypothetical protein
MKYKVLKPMARIGQPYMVGDLIEIEDKAEAGRMIAADIIAPIAGARQIPVETADLKPVGVEKTIKAVKTGSPRKTGAGKKG